MRFPLRASAGIAAMAMTLGLPSQLGATPFELTIATPDFLIPVAGQNGMLTVFSDGRDAETGCVAGPVATSCFDALGEQVFTLGARSSSTGHLTLNLFFTGTPLGDPDYIFNDAEIQFTVTDFDFLTDYVTSKITLREMAIINAVNGTLLQQPIDLKTYLPPGTGTTDDKTITLRPIDLMPPLNQGDFTDPFILSIGLTATVWNSSYSSVKLRNTPEALISGIRLNMDATPRPEPVPEPATGLLLAAGLAFGAARRRRRFVFVRHERS